MWTAKKFWWSNNYYKTYMSKCNVTSLADSILTAPSPPLQFWSPIIYKLNYAQFLRQRPAARATSPEKGTNKRPRRPRWGARIFQGARIRHASESQSQFDTRPARQRKPITYWQRGTSLEARASFETRASRSKGGNQSQLKSLHIEAHPPPLGPCAKSGLTTI